MPCDNMVLYREAMRRVDRPKLAERGFSEAEIDDLAARAELAREKAKAESFGKGETLETQRKKIADAVEGAIDEWHTDIHAQLAHDMDTIKYLGKVRKQVKV
jgi:hypothetical protein